MNDHLCAALVATSSDRGVGTAFHKSSGKIWAFCKRNATLKNPNIYYRNTKKKLKAADMEQYRNTNSKTIYVQEKLLSTIQKLLYEQKANIEIF